MTHSFFQVLAYVPRTLLPPSWVNWTAHPKKDTNMRKAISADERLTLTLRYLAAGVMQQYVQWAGCSSDWDMSLRSVSEVRMRHSDIASTFQGRKSQTKERKRVYVIRRITDWKNFQSLVPRITYVWIPDFLSCHSLDWADSSSHDGITKSTRVSSARQKIENFTITTTTTTTKSRQAFLVRDNWFALTGGLPAFLSLSLSYISYPPCEPRLINCSLIVKLQRCTLR